MSFNNIKRPAKQTGAPSAAQCQKCLQFGHYTYQCKNERTYVSRPTRSQQLFKPSKRTKVEIDPNEIPE
ncbi:zinc knuckle-domain-containing protein [Paraphysoderma sedebokerense]|nr:zinc knuckle-domain-containing protein [Paraphysoderma sedebokerense]